MLTFLLIVAALALISKLGAILLGTYLLFRAFGWVHQANPRLAWGIVGVLVMAGIVTSLGLLYLQRAKSEARAEAAAEAEQQRRAAADQAREEQLRAAETGREFREDLMIRWNAARRTAIRHWREDLVAARAVGNPGVAPPMLSIQDDGSLVTVSNRSADAACVLITRVAVRDAAVLSRCTVGGNRCVTIQGGATARWATLRTGNSESCLSGSLEYRVGNVDHPDPSWWSQSALEAFGGNDPDPGSANRRSDAALLEEIERLEKRIEDRMKVER